MYPQMSLQVTFLDKLLGTISTLVTWTHMNQQVFIERVSPAELLSTMLTFQCFVCFVTHSVIVQAVLGHEASSTFTAQERIAVWVLLLKYKCIYYACYGPSKIKLNYNNSLQEILSVFCKIYKYLVMFTSFCCRIHNNWTNFASKTLFPQVIVGGGIMGFDSFTWLELLLANFTRKHSRSTLLFLNLMSFQVFCEKPLKNYQSNIEAIF